MVTSKSGPFRVRTNLGPHSFQPDFIKNVISSREIEM